LFRPENRHLIEAIQAEIDAQWEDLLRKEAMTAKKEEAKALASPS
jgi:hypothetical protein